MPGPSNPLRPPSTQEGKPVRTRRPSAIRSDKHISCSYPLTGEQFFNLKGDHDDFNALFAASLSQARKFMGTGFKYCILASKVTSLTAVDNLLKRYGKNGAGCAKIAGGNTKAEKAHAQGMCKVLVDHLKTERQRLTPYKPQPHKFKWNWKEWLFTFSIFFALAAIGVAFHKLFGDKKPPPPPPPPVEGPNPTPDPKPEPKPDPEDKPDPVERVWDDPEFYPIRFPKPIYNPFPYGLLEASYTVDYTGMLNSWDHLQLEQEFIKSTRESAGTLAIAKMIIAGGVITIAAVGTAICWADLVPDPGDVAFPALFKLGVSLVRYAPAAGAAAYSFGLFDSDEAHADPLFYDPPLMDDLFGDDLLPLDSPVTDDGAEMDDDYSNMVCE